LTISVVDLAMFLLHHTSHLSALTCYCKPLPWQINRVDILLISYGVVNKRRLVCLCVCIPFPSYLELDALKPASSFSESCLYLTKQPSKSNSNVPGRSHALIPRCFALSCLNLELYFPPPENFTHHQLQPLCLLLQPSKRRLL